MEITPFALNNFAPEKFFGEAKFVTMNTPQKFQECRFRLHYDDDDDDDDDYYYY